jgi:hypothetical protein
MSNAAEERGPTPQIIEFKPVVLWASNRARIILLQAKPARKYQFEVSTGRDPLGEPRWKETEDNNANLIHAVADFFADAHGHDGRPDTPSFFGAAPTLRQHFPDWFGGPAT